MPQAAAAAVINAPRLSDVQQAIARIPGPGNQLMVMPNDMPLIPLTNAITTGPNGEVFYTVVGYFDFATLTSTVV